MVGLQHEFPDEWTFEGSSEPQLELPGTRPVTQQGIYDGI